jgi:hypothetical protein
VGAYDHRPGGDASVTVTSHLSFGALVYLVVSTITGLPLSVGGAAITLAGSILPDIDTETSLAGRLLLWVSRPIERTFGHRTLTHSFQPRGRQTYSGPSVDSGVAKRWKGGTK